MTIKTSRLPTTKTVDDSQRSKGVDRVSQVPWIDPEIAAALAKLPKDIGDVTEESLAAMRKAAIPMAEGIKLSDEVERTDHVVPGPAGAPEITLRVHRPRGADDLLPCIYSIHGGGYVLGSYEIEDLRLDQWCTRLGCVGVAVDYRLAPEHSYPGPLEDCYAGIRWVHEHAEELGIHPARIGIAGASAGGGLAAALALLARDRGGPPIQFELLDSPMIDDRQMTPSSSWQVPIWNPASNAFGWRAYLGDLYGADSLPHYAVPSRAPDLSGLPPTFVCVGTADAFYDEDVAYATRLNYAGVPVELHVYAGAPHGFGAIRPAPRLSRRVHREMTEWLEHALGVEPDASPDGAD